MRCVRTLAEFLRDLLFHVSVERAQPHLSLGGRQGRVGDEQAVAEQLLPVEPSQPAHHEARKAAVQCGEPGRLRGGVIGSGGSKRKCILSPARSTTVKPTMSMAV